MYDMFNYLNSQNLLLWTVLIFHSRLVLNLTSLNGFEVIIIEHHEEVVDASFNRPHLNQYGTKWKTNFQFISVLLEFVQTFASLKSWCNKLSRHLIADSIMAGFLAKPKQIKDITLYTLYYLLSNTCANL